MKDRKFTFTVVTFEQRYSKHDVQTLWQGVSPNEVWTHRKNHLMVVLEGEHTKEAIAQILGHEYFNAAVLTNPRRHELPFKLPGISLQQ